MCWQRDERLSDRLSFDPIAEAGRQWRRRWGSDQVAPMEAVTSVMRVQQILLARCNQALEPFGLSFARYEALMLLSFTREERCRWARSACASRSTQPASPT